MRPPATSARLSAVRSRSLPSLRDPHGVRDLRPVLRADTAGRPRRAIDRAVRRELATGLYRGAPQVSWAAPSGGGDIEARRAPPGRAERWGCGGQVGAP